MSGGIKVRPDCSLLESINNKDESVVINDQVDVTEELEKTFSTPSVMDIILSDSVPGFTEFKLRQVGNGFLIGFCLMETILNLTLFWKGFVEGLPLFFQVVEFLMLLIPICGWTYIYFKASLTWNEKSSTSTAKVYVLGNVIVLLQAILSSLLMVSWVIERHDCHSGGCWGDTPDKVIPLRLLFIETLVVVAMPVFYACHHVAIALLSVVLIYTTVVVCALVLHLGMMDVTYIVLFGIITLAFLLTLKGSLLTNFNSYSKFETFLRKKLMSQNNELLMRLQMEEMGHMIGMYVCMLCY